MTNRERLQFTYARHRYRRQRVRWADATFELAASLDDLHEAVGAAMEPALANFVRGFEAHLERFRAIGWGSR